MELYIVRHGTTDWNEQKRFQGRQDTELNEEGRSLAAELGHRLSARGIVFDRIYSSPLKRALETALLIRGKSDCPVITDERLAEISFGELEGMKYDDWMNTDLPRKYFFSDPARYVPPEGGETMQSVCERTADFIKTVIEPLYIEKKDAKVLITAHGALLAGMTCCLDGHGPDSFWGSGLKGNCEETVYQYDGTVWKKL